MLELALQHAPPWVEDILVILGALFAAGLAGSKMLHYIIIPAMERLVKLTSSKYDDDFLTEVKRVDTAFIRFLHWVDENIPHLVKGPKPQREESESSTSSRPRTPPGFVATLMLFTFALSSWGCATGVSTLRQTLDASSEAVLKVSRDYRPVMVEARERAEQAATLAEFDDIMRTPMRVAEALEAAKTALLLAELGIDAYESGRSDDMCSVVADVVTALSRVVTVLRELTEFGDGIPAQLESGLAFLGTFLTGRCDRAAS